MKNLVNTIIEQKRKNGNYVLTAEQQELLKTFVDFDLAKDWIDSKEITKMGKLIFTHIKNVIDIKPSKKAMQQMSLYGIEYLESNKIDRIRGYRYENIEEADLKAEIDAIYEAYKQWTPVADKLKQMREERAMINGKLPKAEREKIEREQIKGDLDPQLKNALDQVCTKFEAVIKDHMVDYLLEKIVKAKLFHAQPEPARGNWNDIATRRIHDAWQKKMAYFSDVVATSQNGVYYYIDETQIEKRAIEYAKMQAEQFFFKMADKLGGMITGTTLEKVTEEMRGNNAFESVMVFKFTGNTTFTVLNKVVLNWSPLGTPFHQYPCTFHNAIVEGVKVDTPCESTVKSAFIKAFQK